jgi:hypothetical protein
MLKAPTTIGFERISPAKFIGTWLLYQPLLVSNGRGERESAIIGL